MKKSGIELIATERQEQIEKHGYKKQLDKKYESKIIINKLAQSNN